MLNKRGQGLSMTMIIVIILAVLVLIVIGIIFTGSSTTLTKQIREFFGVSTTGTDIDIVRAQCNTLCQTAKLDPNNAQGSGYCTSKFEVKGEGGKQSCSDVGVTCEVTC